MNTNLKTLLYFPFTRFLAFVVDLILSDLLFIAVLRISGHQFDELTVTQAVMGSLGLCFLLIEPLLLATWGKTVGSSLLKIKIADAHGSKLGYFRALARSIVFLILGLGFGINIIVLAVLVVANYLYFLRNSEFCWDKFLGVDIGQESPSALKILIVLAVVGAVLYFGYSASNSSTIETSQNIQPPNKAQQFTTPEYGYTFTNGKYQKR